MKKPTFGESVERGFESIAKMTAPVDAEMTEEEKNRFGFAPERKRYVNGGVQFVFKFENGYGASVVKHIFSYGHDQGLWELAVFKDDDICYFTPITNDIMGNMTEKEVEKTLERIKKLKKLKKAKKD